MPSLQKCTQCGKEFVYDRSKPRRKNVFCSKDCFCIHRFGRKYTGKVSRVCINCGKSFSRYLRFVNPSRRSFCTHACFSAHNQGKNHQQWTGGKFIDEDGYIRINVGGKHRAEHLLIVERALGRKLRAGEVVHHINGNKRDNRHGNLLVCDTSYHKWLHSRMSQLYQQEHFGRV